MTADDSFDMATFLEAVSANKSPHLVTVGKYQEIQIRRATAVQVFQILQMVKSVAKAMEVKSLSDIDSLVIKIDDPVFFLEVVSSAWPEMLALCQSLSSMTKDQIEGLDIDDLILLAWRLWKINEGFFMSRVLPMVRKIGLGGPEDQSKESLDQSSRVA